MAAGGNGCRCIFFFLSRQQPAVLKQVPCLANGLCYTIIMSSDERIQSSDSQVPKCLWGGSKVMNRRFMANLHRITTESQFQKWRATFASAIVSNVHVRLTEPSTKCVAHIDPITPQTWG
ncbi:hypothetical protein L3X38_037778 [Prunus dulcis]|uniref:Uncharacterized protein n=1 Tax=Prunus dulcis TaxID=3755 RepID=A0AAD4YQY0_PRUDU|nr:hypothetical protein L3X38_037778 [Prunus dulcis]